jgi:Ca2+-dependent lipid-binding protein
MSTGGTFKLHIYEAKLYRDTEFMGHMDPFVVVEVTPEKKEYRTKVLNDAGKNPNWDETIEIPLASLKDTNLKITCYDEDIMMNDFVGQHIFSASELLINGVTPTWYDL